MRMDGFMFLTPVWRSLGCCRVGCVCWEVLDVRNEPQEFGATLDRALNAGLRDCRLCVGD